MSKTVYYSNKRIKEHNAEYNILIGERANGKSYNIKLEECLKPAIKEKKQTFIIIRRMAEDLRKGFIDEYFADMPIEKLTKGEYNTVTGYRDDIYLGNISEDGSIKRGIKIGKAIPLSAYERYKSRAYPDVNTIVFEEFVTAGLYLRDEVKNFMNLCSTILRRRKGKAWMICNTISRVCPYFQTWSLNNIPYMKQGAIDEYVFHEQTKNGETQDVKICVEYCANAGEESSGMFFGKFKKSIDGGAWEVDEYPHLPDERSAFETVYTLGLTALSFGFNIALLLHKIEEYMIVYVYPSAKVGDEFRQPERQIKETFSTDVMVSNKLREDIPAEAIMIQKFKEGKVVYATNLCGADFTSTIKNMKVKPY